MSAEQDIESEMHAELKSATTASAPLAWAQAPTLCFRDADGAQPCRAYHQIWQYLSLLGVSGSIRTDTVFLIETIRRLAREDGARRVAITGTADYGMLAHVLRAFALEHIEPEVTVVDRCPTSLMLNRWYAERLGATVTTVEADVLSYRPPQPVDIVASHSFLGWFSPDDMLRLTRAWHDMLAPSGAVITTRRIYNARNNREIKRFDADEADAYGDRLRDAACAYKGTLPATPKAMGDVARDYARGFRRYPATSEVEVAGLFTSVGFEAPTIDNSSRPDAGVNRPTGPLRRAGARLRLIVRRPG